MKVGPFSVTIASDATRDPVLLTAEICVARDLVAVVRHEPGQPFMLELCAPPAGAPVFDLPCEAFVEAIRTAMARLG